MIKELYTPMQIELRERARELADTAMRPVAAKYDEAQEYPWEVQKAIKAAGLSGVWIPEEYGGMGGGVLDLCLVVEEFSRACGGMGVGFAVNALGSFPIIVGGTDEQKERWLPGIAAGEKKWNTGGAVASYNTIFAVTNPDRGARGISAFVVEEGTEGYTVGKHEDKMGIRCVPVVEIHLDKCQVPEANLLGGREGQGFKHAMITLDRARPGVAAQAVGLAQGALDLAMQYTHERQQFGQSVSSFQGVQWMLSDMATQIEAARQLVHHAARVIDSGHRHITKVSAMCKLMATDVAMKVTTDCVQLFGGYGYCKDYPIEKFMRDAKITQIYEGTNQIQRLVIARNLLREAAGGAK
jgi:butyryl-CoA dehydrogenase